MTWPNFNSHGNTATGIFHMSQKVTIFGCKKVRIYVKSWRNYRHEFVIYFLDMLHVILHQLIITRICLLTDTTVHSAVTAMIGEKVLLHCASPRDNPYSVTWRYQSSGNSNKSIVLARIEQDRISQLEISGRLSLNRTVRNSYHLVIHEIQQSDSGTYTCSVDVGYMKQHVTVLNVKGMIFIALLPLPWTILSCLFTFL